MQKGIEALWSIEFEAAGGFYGAGVVIFETDRIFGGDAQYFYTGTFKLNGGNITAQVKVTRYADPGVGLSIFGTDDKEFELNFRATLTEPIMTATGSRIDGPATQVRARFTKQADLP